MEFEYEAGDLPDIGIDITTTLDDKIVEWTPFLIILILAVLVAIAIYRIKKYNVYQED